MQNLEELIGVFTEINDKESMKQFFYEIFTPAELKDFSLRWELLKKLYQKKTQREIAGELKISLCKITRGSKLLKNKDSITQIILSQLLKKQ
ncbi:MAG TPA: transcriptional regulator [Spirochaetia bacterium]|nr:transcriptional regulator [Spirochaetia bacterium]